MWELTGYRGVLTRGRGWPSRRQRPSRRRRQAEASALAQITPDMRLRTPHVYNRNFERLGGLRAQTAAFCCCSVHPSARRVAFRGFEGRTTPDGRRDRPVGIDLRKLVRGDCVGQLSRVRYHDMGGVQR